MLEQLIAADIDPTLSPAAPTPAVHIRRGAMVEVLGPWSNGHTEQIGLVTWVYGDGLPGDRVNLHVFVDEDQPLIASRVVWYPTRLEAEQATRAQPEQTDIVGAPAACYSVN